LFARRFRQGLERLPGSIPSVFELAIDVLSYFGKSDGELALVKQLSQKEILQQKKFSVDDEFRDDTPSGDEFPA